MKKRKLSAAGLTGALSLLLCAALLLCGVALPPQFGETFLGELPAKLRRLAETPGRRIVFIGGSSVPFALRSELVEAALPDFRAVDLGLYADLGTTVMLDLALPDLRAGDLVVIAPEQSAQTLSSDFRGEALWQATDGALELLVRLSPARCERLAAAYPAFAGKKLHYALTGAPVPEGIYARASFNAFGDIASPDRIQNIMPGGWDPAVPVAFSKELLQADFLAELNDFARRAAEKGAAVYYHFSPMNAAALAPGTEVTDIDDYYDALRAALDFPILGDPHRCLLDAAWFYDTNFHLNDSGATVFTKLMIEDLKVALKDTSATAIDLPATPSLAAARASAPDDSCADCFTYARGEGGWLLTGLTDKGREASVLVLPGSWQGEAVVGMAETLFAGGTKARRIVVQPNIARLPDGAFRECTQLQALSLTSPRPSDYAAGDGLRDGASFLIYVPAAAVDSYRRDYFWQKYDAYLLPEP